MKKPLAILLTLILTLTPFTTLASIPTGTDWGLPYQDTALRQFTAQIIQREIAGATTEIEELRAIYNFIQMQFRHTNRGSTGTRREAIDGSRRPAWQEVPFPDGFYQFGGNVMGDQSAIGRTARDLGTRGDGLIVRAWEILFGLHGSDVNFADLFVFMARLQGFEAKTMEGSSMGPTGQQVAHTYPAVRFNNNWYIFDVQRESLANNTNQPRHQYFMQPVAHAHVQDVYFLCPNCLAYFANTPRVQGATRFTAGQSPWQPPATAQPSPAPTAPATQPQATASAGPLRFVIGSTAFTGSNASGTLEAAPFIQDGRTMVPLRVIGEALGAENLQFSQGVITFSISGRPFTMTVGQELPGGMGAPMIVSERTFVPLGFIANEMGAQARWDGGAQAAYVYLGGATSQPATSPSAPPATGQHVANLIPGISYTLSVASPMVTRQLPFSRSLQVADFQSLYVPDANVLRVPRNTTLEIRLDSVAALAGIPSADWFEVSVYSAFASRSRGLAGWTAYLRTNSTASIQVDAMGYWSAHRASGQRMNDGVVSTWASILHLADQRNETRAIQGDRYTGAVRDTDTTPGPQTKYMTLVLDSPGAFFVEAVALTPGGVRNVAQASGVWVYVAE